MRVTVEGEVDLEVRPGTPAAAIAAAAGMGALWCGSVRLDPEHPAGTAPLVHAARLSAGPEPEHCVPADAAGPVLRVVEGPDAGGSVRLTHAGTLIGRAPHCDLTIADPSVSETHVMVASTGKVRDAGSANGTRAGRVLRAGQALRLGRSTVVLDGEAEQDSARTDTLRAPAWGAMAAAGAGGIGIAVITGRWYLALVGLAVPLAMLAPVLVRRLRRSAEPEPEWQPPSGPLAVVGDERWARGYVRAIALARGRAPGGDGWREPWMRWLDEARDEDLVVHVPAGGTAPSWCTTTVIAGALGRVERSADGALEAPPLAVSAAVAEARARAAASARGAATLPTSLTWGDLNAADVPPVTSPGLPRRLVAALGRGEQGPVAIDLDADGPHLLVAGTTGSGKSVTLETLVASLALAHAPQDLAIALVDFKGGAGLRSCLSLPHVCGSLTDLDEGMATRVIDALSDELAVRKRAVAERGLTSLSAWEASGGAPARLLVVIDEYQEIVSRHPSFLPDLARLAAQGRSLGLHLVLATQRPAGAVTPEVRANVSTTIALRVASVAESRDLVGTADAAELPPQAPGRAVIARAGALETVQIAAPIADPSPAVARVGSPVPQGRPLAAAAADRWASAPPAPPLWLDPLPQSWEPPPGTTARLALADWPRERRQGPVTWEPADGPAVIVGPARSGRTSALRCLAQQAQECGLRPVWLPADAREAARTVHLAARERNALLIVDDAERALARLGEADDAAAADALLTRLSMRAPTALACAPHAPVRLAAAAAITALLPGQDASVMVAWGAPRDAPLSHRGPGRAWVSVDGAWVEAQLGRADHHSEPPWVQPLPESVTEHWAVGGDHARPVAAPQGRVAVLGPPGAARDAIAASMPDATVTCHDALHLVPPADATLVLDPTVRAVRALAPRDWQGIVDPLSREGRCALIVDGAAIAVQLGVR